MKHFSIKTLLICLVLIISIVFTLTVTANDKVDRIKTEKIIMEDEFSISKQIKGKEKEKTFQLNKQEISLNYTYSTEEFVENKKFDVYEDDKNNQYQLDEETGLLIGYINTNNLSIPINEKENLQKINNIIDKETSLKLAREYINSVYGEFQEYDLIFNNFSEINKRHEIFFYKQIDGYKIHSFIIFFISQSGEVLLYSLNNTVDYNEIKDIKINSSKLNSQILEYKKKNNLLEKDLKEDYVIKQRENEFYMQVVLYGLSNGSDYYELDIPLNLITN